MTIKKKVLDMIVIIVMESFTHHIYYNNDFNCFLSPRLLNLAGTQAGKQSTGSKVATTRLTLILPLGRNHKYLRSYSTTGNIPNFTLKNKLNLLE